MSDQLQGDYLVLIPPSAAASQRWLFISNDPRRQNCPFPVVENVFFLHEIPHFDELPPGKLRPHVLVREKKRPNHFFAFRPGDKVPDIYEILDGVAEDWYTWEEFKNNTRLAP